MFHQFGRLLWSAALLWSTGLLSGTIAMAEPTDGEDAKSNWSTLQEVLIRSTVDGTEQPSLYLAPSSPQTEPAPLLVFLHSWSTTYHQENKDWLNEAEARGWLFLHPNFRGRNETPQACGSRIARQDVVDALDWMISKYSVDTRRIYLAGTSGGGHMTMLMLGHHPDRFSAASAWVGISNLADWYVFHNKDGNLDNYGSEIVKCLGGPPGTSPQVDAEYRDRSPRFHLHNAVSVPLDIAAGVSDGHTGSVPIEHSLLAFNVLAKTQNLPVVGKDELDELWAKQRLSNPGPSDQGIDPTYQREILLRRTAGKCRVTIFDGGHEGLHHAACDWLSNQQRDTQSPAK